MRILLTLFLCLLLPCQSILGKDASISTAIAVENTDNIFESYEEGNILEINLDGLNGYPSSFFEEAFGGIARIYGVEKVKKALRLICKENNLVVDDIKSYIEQKRT